MAHKLITKEEIIKNAYDLFSVKGYNSTSVADISDRCGIYKSNLYHYFENKEDIMKEVLIAASDWVIENIHAMLLDNELPHYERMEQYLGVIKDINLNTGAGCIFGNIGLEIKLQNDDLKDIIADHFEKSLEIMQSFFMEITDYDDAIKNAYLLLSKLEGAILMATISGNIEYCETMKNCIMDDLRELLTKEVA